MYYEPLILGLIHYKPVHGYEIKSHLEQFNRNINGSEVSNNTIYPLLSRYEKQGITTRQIINQDSKPSKFLHQITDYGKLYFYRMLNGNIHSVITSREEFSMRLLFFPLILPKNRLSLLDQREEHIVDSLVTIEHPIHEWPLVVEGFDLRVAVDNLIPFYNQLISDELILIEAYRAHIDDPCIIPNELLSEIPGAV